MDVATEEWCQLCASLHDRPNIEEIWKKMNVLLSNIIILENYVATCALHHSEYSACEF